MKKVKTGLFAGIDGGGTKTKYLLSDRDGNICGEYIGVGCSYKQWGFEAAGEEIARGLREALKGCDALPEDITGIGIGLPCFGEDPAGDRKMEKILSRKLPPVPVRLVNDAEAGWAGALGLRPGIHLVAGTGSIAFGKDQQGRQFRAGGWSEFFSDCGSGYWCGRKTMELFAKEAEGILPKGALYGIIRKNFCLEKDFDFIVRMEKEYLPFRDKTASLQKLLLQAARLGDREAEKIYQEAAGELGLLIGAVERNLDFTERPVRVTAFGGLFHAKEYLLPVLEKSWKITSPDFEPAKGALLLAAEAFSEEQVNVMMETWYKEGVVGRNAEIFGSAVYQ